MSQCSGATTLSNHERLKLELPNRFLRIKMKHRQYEGKETIVFYFKNVSFKVRSKIVELSYLERKQEETQAESYKSCISHELRTPLNNIKQVVESILGVIASKKRPSKSSLASISDQLKLSYGQLALMEYFIEDLLNLRLLREGYFEINKAVFDLHEALDFVVDIF